MGLSMAVMRGLREQEVTERERQARYGYTRPVIYADLAGRKYVAVGSKLYYGTWPTFTDFLMDYARVALGIPWWEAESKKPLAEQHQVLKWFEGVRHVQRRVTRNEDGFFSAEPTGHLSAFIHLAYDLYVLGHHSRLQGKIIRRLRILDQFQGARYELFVTATFIRAGFEIDFENETDRSRTHTEFTATYREGGQRISVEAKSRHRPGLLGYPGQRTDDEAVPTRLGHLLNQALSKRTSLPLVVFLDVNLPPDRAAVVFHSYRDGWPEMLSNVKRNVNRKDLFNSVVFSNIPHHYADEDQVDPERQVLFVRSQVPMYPLIGSGPLLALEQAVLQYANVPTWFSDDSPEARKYGLGLGYVVSRSEPWTVHSEARETKRKKR